MKAGLMVVGWGAFFFFFFLFKIFFCCGIVCCCCKIMRERGISYSYVCVYVLYINYIVWVGRVVVHGDRIISYAFYWEIRFLWFFFFWLKGLGRAEVEELEGLENWIFLEKKKRKKKKKGFR